MIDNPLSPFQNNPPLCPIPTHFPNCLPFLIITLLSLSSTIMFDDLDLDSFKKNYTKLTKAQFNQRYNFQNGEWLGEGTYGAVRKVTTQQGQELAIKQFNAKAAQQIRQIIRQVDNIKILTHNNIAKFIDCYIVDDKNYFIVMEYCPGGCLTDFLEKNAISDQQKIKLCKNIVDGLAHAHHKKIVHRDLKPDNILIGKSNIAKICDFGCSVLSQDPEGSSAILSTNIGTPAYMDIRISAGKHYDISVDIYSLGMIFISMFKGSGIYDKCKTIAQLQKMRTAFNSNYQKNVEELLQDVPQIMKNIIKSCLQPDHKQRYKAEQISAILQKELNSNTSKMSKLLSTVDDQQIQDQSSLFAIGLINYYKNIDLKQQNLSTRKKVFELLKNSKQNMDRITAMQKLKYVQANTKEQFTTFVLFYYFFWLKELELLLHGAPSQVKHRYLEITPELIEEEVINKAQKHILSQRDKFSTFFIKCCKQQKNKLNLMDPKEHRPASYKTIIKNMVLYSINDFDFSQYDDNSLREQLRKFLEKRIKTQFRLNSKKDDEQSCITLDKIQCLIGSL